MPGELLLVRRIYIIFNWKISCCYPKAYNVTAYLQFTMAPQVTWAPYVPRTGIKFLKSASKLWRVSHIAEEPKSLGISSVKPVLGLFTGLIWHTYLLKYSWICWVTKTSQEENLTFHPENAAESFPAQDHTQTLQPLELWNYLNAMHAISKI